MTSDGLGIADPPAGPAHLFALLRRRFASASLHSVLQEMARPKGFEPLTPRFVVWCSIQLSYGRAVRRMGCGAKGRDIG